MKIFEKERLESSKRVKARQNARLVKNCSNTIENIENVKKKCDTNYNKHAMRKRKQMRSNTK